MFATRKFKMKEIPWRSAIDVVNEYEENHERIGGRWGLLFTGLGTSWLSSSMAENFIRHCSKDTTMEDLLSFYNHGIIYHYHSFPPSYLNLLLYNTENNLLFISWLNDSIASLWFYSAQLMMINDVWKRPLRTEVIKGGLYCKRFCSHYFCKNVMIITKNQMKYAQKMNWVYKAISMSVRNAMIHVI